MLRDTIEGDAMLLGLLNSESDSSLLTALNSVDIPVRDTTLRSTRWLMLNFTNIVSEESGATESDVILGTLQASSNPRVRAAYEAMGSFVVDLSDPQVQTMIGVLGAAAGWPSDLIARLKAAGVTSQTSHALQSLGRAAVQADINTVRREYVWAAQAEQIDMAKNEWLAGAESAAVLRMKAVVAQLEA